jgi:hypothetical protein
MNPNGDRLIRRGARMAAVDIVSNGNEARRSDESILTS